MVDEKQQIGEFSHVPEQKLAPEVVMGEVGKKLDAANDKLKGRLFYPFWKPQDGGHTISRLFDSALVHNPDDGSLTVLAFDDRDGFRKIVARPNEFRGQNHVKDVENAIVQLRSKSTENPFNVGPITGDYTPGHNRTADGSMNFCLPHGLRAENHKDDLQYMIASPDEIKAILHENVLLAQEREKAERLRKMEEERNSAVGIATQVLPDLPQLLQLEN